jgi:hypothetical protein
VARLIHHSAPNFQVKPVQAAATRNRPVAPSSSNVCKPIRHTTQPRSVSTTKGSKARVGSSGTFNHLGPAVNKKPTKNSGIKPSDINKACAVLGFIIHTTCILLVLRASSMVVHHKAMVAIMTAPLKNARRCGAASNQLHRHVIFAGGNGFLGAMRMGRRTDGSVGLCSGLSSIASIQGTIVPPSNHNHHPLNWSARPAACPPSRRRWTTARTACTWVCATPPMRATSPGSTLFDEAAIANGIRYAHERGRKVFMALNTYPQAANPEPWRNDAMDRRWPTWAWTPSSWPTPA